MSIEVKVPALPESVTEATVVGWHKKAGDRVTRDENLVDLETDKVVLEVPAPRDGILDKILKEEGATVTADDVLARLEQGETNARDAADDQAEEPMSANDEEGNKKPNPTPNQDDDELRNRTAESAAAAQRTDNLSPAVRRMVAEHELDPTQIEGTGRNGRLTKEDVIRHLESHEQTASGKGDSSGASPETGPASRQSEQPSKSATRETHRISSTELSERPQRRAPMTRLRQRIAERLVEAQQSTAMLTTFNECNMQPIMSLRNLYKERFERHHGIKLGIMSFFVKTVVEALKRFPAINASIDGKDIIYHGYYDIGVAVSTERGLLVPVLRDADQLSFAEIEQAIANFGRRARESKIHIDELTGGTFTITNGGIFGSLMSTPILNPPQSGILGMHKIQDRPVVENGTVAVRPMMYLALSYDHRIIDGREAVQFLVTIKELIEDPSRLLLEV